HIKTQSKTFMTFGFPLKHMYVDGANYKGADLIMYHTLESLMNEYDGNLSIMPYKIIRCDDERDDDSCISAEQPYDAEEVESNHEQDFAFIHWNKFKHAYDVLDENEYENRYKYMKQMYGAVKYNVQWMASPSNFCYKDTVPTYGNEPSTENLYCAGCILIHVYPESDK
ncbi:MAG: hypothetical protein RLZZ262_755, partial [Bacteroidota bacterium]